MKLSHLQCLCEIAERALNISRAATHLHVTQPSVSRQLQLLESELGLKLLLRRKNKIIALTREGEHVLAKARHIVRDVRDLSTIREALLDAQTGSLTVATTHFHARFTLLNVIKKFRVRYPRISISIHQEDPEIVAKHVRSGYVDFGVSVEAEAAGPAVDGDLFCLPCYTIRRVLITPPRHPLLSVKRITLEALARFPLITYSSAYSGGWRVLKAFEARGLKPNIALSAIDADVIKAYVAAGLGIAVIQEAAFDARRDKNLHTRSADHLFGPTVATVILRRGGFLKRYVYDFIHLLAPHLNRQEILQLSTSVQL